MPVYVWSESVGLVTGRKGADPQVIGEALENLCLENDGLLKPAIIVEAAKAGEHPLHAHFTWSDRKAAQRWRLEEARVLVRSVRIVVEDVDTAPSAFFGVMTGPKDQVGYRSYRDVANTPNLRDLVLRQALHDLEVWKRKYKQLVALFAIEEPFLELRRRLGGDEDRPSL
jgi:hypothetical protein